VRFRKSLAKRGYAVKWTQFSSVAPQDEIQKSLSLIALARKLMELLQEFPQPTGW